MMGDPEGTLTVHYDDGSKPVFQKYEGDSARSEAEARLRELAAQGRFAIILEDHDD